MGNFHLHDFLWGLRQKFLHECRWPRIRKPFKQAVTEPDLLWKFLPQISLCVSCPVVCNSLQPHAPRQALLSMGIFQARILGYSLVASPVSMGFPKEGIKFRVPSLQADTSLSETHIKSIKFGLCICEPYFQEKKIHLQQTSNQVLKWAIEENDIYFWNKILYMKNQLFCLWLRCFQVFNSV